MLRLAFISQAEQSSQKAATEMRQACARLRGVELTTVAGMDESSVPNQMDQFDAVVLHVPVHRRMELTCRYAKEGKHVLVQGPMAQTTQDADQIIACCRDASVRLMMGGTVRFHPTINAVKVALDSKRLGVPALFRSHSWQTVKKPTSIESATLLFQQVDLAGWIFDRLPTEIYAVQHVDRSDTLQIHLGFPQGGMGLITISEALPAGDRYCSCTVIGSTGAVYADDQRQVQLLYQGDLPRAARTDEGILALVDELREFTTAIQQNREPSASGSDGRRARQFMDAVRHSINLHQPLQWEGANYVAVR